MNDHIICIIVAGKVVGTYTSIKEADAAYDRLADAEVKPTLSWYCKKHDTTFGFSTIQCPLCIQEK